MTKAAVASKGVKGKKLHNYPVIVNWKWYTITQTMSTKFEVKNNITEQVIQVTSENAALKVIELAYALRGGEEAEWQDPSLQEKAKRLEGYGKKHEHFVHWDDKIVPYGRHQDKAIDYAHMKDVRLSHFNGVEI